MTNTNKGITCTGKVFLLNACGMNQIRIKTNKNKPAGEATVVPGLTHWATSGILVIGILTIIPAQNTFINKL
jgi:hypothetical protein